MRLNEYIVKNLLGNYERMIFMSLSMLLLAFGVLSLLFIILGILLYVMLAYGLYCLARNEGIGNEWFAFIPILQLYIIGKILKEIKIKTYTVPSLELVLPLTPIAAYITNAIFDVIPLIGGILSLIFNIGYLAFSIIVIYNFYKRYKGEQATLMTILSVVLPFMGPIYIFGLKDSKPL